MRSDIILENWTAIATAALAAVTFWLVLEARMTRREAARRDREVAFRAALVELASNIQYLETWKPSLESSPPEEWLKKPLSFAAMKDLLARAWVPGVLWDRIMTLVVNLGSYQTVVTSQSSSLRPTPEYDPQRENVQELYYVIDLYLKQLACYLIAEMRRQRLGMPRGWARERSLFAPLDWRYDVRFGSTALAVQNIELHFWPPFTPQAPEPNMRPYAQCKLERLIRIAKQKSEETAAQLHEALESGKIAGADRRDK